MKIFHANTTFTTLAAFLVIITALLIISATITAVDVNPKNVKTASISATLTWKFAFTGSPGSFTFETFDFPNDEFTSSEVISSSSPFEKKGDLLRFSLPAKEEELQVQWRASNLKNRIEKITQSDQGNLDKYLLDSKYVQVTPAIAQKALEITAGETDNFKRAVLLSEWVHRNVEYDLAYADNTLTASEVFNIRRGVCNEYAHLLLAMLRSLKIPARFSGGFVYSGEEWAPHAWVEVAINKQWIPFDPTYNEAYILDGTHFKLASGMDQSEVREQLSFAKSNGEVSIKRASKIKFTQITNFKHEDSIWLQSNSTNVKSKDKVKIFAFVKSTFGPVVPISILAPPEVKILGEKTNLLYVGNASANTKGVEVEWSLLVPNDLTKGYNYVYPVIISTLGEEHNYSIKATAGAPLENAYEVQVLEVRLKRYFSLEFKENLALLSFTFANNGNAPANFNLSITITASTSNTQVNRSDLKISLQPGEIKEIQIETNSTTFDSFKGKATMSNEEKTQEFEFYLAPLSEKPQEQKQLLNLENRKENQNEYLAILNSNQNLKYLALAAVMIIILAALYFSNKRKSAPVV